jgi:hypothetical protein
MSDSAAMMARIVRIKREEGKTGLFYATSPDLKGLIVSASTLDALDRKTPGAIAEMYAACGVDVVVTRVDEQQADDFRSWVAVPTAVAKRALTEHV